MPWKKLIEFSDLNTESLLAIITKEAGVNSSLSLITVAKRILEIPEICCSIHIGKDDGVEEFITKWATKFISGYENRPSQRTSNPIGTQHDPILDEIITARSPMATEDLEAIRYGHRLSMSAENITGSLLEEYIAKNLLKYDWHCCWGETMKSIDLCHKNGQLLQIKNSDNSENSSSKTVRDGTKIQHWYRRISRTGETNWAALNKLAGVSTPKDKLSEDSFIKFVRNAVSKNPGSVFLEEESPWYGKDKSK
ncbi:MAG: hypothetical protein ACI9DK_002465 [Vicingaceae bacterium]|jgi:hypothetical protein